MKALTWHGKGDIRCERVADPSIEDDRDKHDGCVKVVMKPEL